MLLDQLKTNGVKEYPEGYSIEVEAEFKSTKNLPDFPAFQAKRDGSLIHNGLEFISRKPKGKNDLLKDLDDLLSSPGFKKDYINTERTSTHVHINVQRWSKEELLTFLTIYYLVEGLLFNFTGKSRKSNLFCLPLYDAERSTMLFTDLIEDNYKSIIVDFENYKYSALNIASIARLGTVEFRHMYGTNDFHKIKDWLTIVDTLVRSRFRFKNAQEVFDRFIYDRRGFLKDIFGPLLPLVDHKDWWELTDLNYSSVFKLINLPEELRYKKRKIKKVYKFKTELEEDDLKCNEYLR